VAVESKHDRQLAAGRLQQIQRLVQEQQQVRVAELSERLGVSEPTVRRDLQKLEDQGRVRRAHGGAVAVARDQDEPPVMQRATENAEEKRRIGQAAAELVHDGDTIFLGSGTTTYEVARHLRGKRDLTVITNALNIANVLAARPEITLIVTGGVVRHSELSLTGHIVTQTLKEIRADKVIVSMPAVSLEEGLANSNLLETLTDRSILQVAREVILVADHTKFGRVATGIIAPITAVQTVVTDTQASADTVAALRDLGISVILA
jgi:DeoR/GlpR family transcriptional regulator of sugar metabolism